MPVPNRSSSNGTPSALLIALADVQSRPAKLPGDPGSYPGEASVEARLMPGADAARTPDTLMTVVVERRHR